MGDYLSWDLASLVSYTAGEVLECKVTFKAPEDSDYYLVGALYTTGLEMISGTFFGVLLPSGEVYAINSSTHMTEWEMVEDEEKEQDCKLTLGYSSVILALYFYKMAGTEPSLEDDELVDSVSTSLSGPAVAAELDLSSLMVMAMMVGMMSMMMASAFKE